MDGFYIFTTLGFLEIILATLLVIEIQNKTKELKALLSNIDSQAKLELEELKKFRYKLSEFNNEFDKKTTLSSENLGVISKIAKESFTETIIGKMLLKKTNLTLSSLDKLWKHKTEIAWLLLAVFLTDSKAAKN